VFEIVSFWVRMFNLPLAYMSESMGVQVGNSVGVVEKVETDEYGIGWGEYFCVKLRLDITKPLARGRFLKYKGESTWVAFQYERLPRFCFYCGIIRHGVGGCLNSKGGHFPRDQANLQFGSWLRASMAFKQFGVEKGWSDRTADPSISFHTSSANSSKPGGERAVSWWLIWVVDGEEARF
jgi:hypothetical protein